MRRRRIFARARNSWNVALFGAALTAGLIRAEQVDVSELTLVGIAEADGVTYASLYDAQNGEHFLASTKSADGGLELVAVTEGESATIRQNGRSFLLRLSWPAATAELANDVARPTETVQNIPLPGSVEAATPKPPPNGKLPLVFQTGDLAKLNLSDEQKAAITRLRQQFVAAIGGGPAAVAGGITSTTSEPDAAALPATTTALPSTATPAPEPPYQDWLTAQEKSDAEFVMLFGQEAFNLSQMAPHAGASP
jgi:hypothetical protein